MHETKDTHRLHVLSIKDHQKGQFHYQRNFENCLTLLHWSMTPFYL